MSWAMWMDGGLAIREDDDFNKHSGHIMAHITDKVHRLLGITSPYSQPLVAYRER